MSNTWHLAIGQVWEDCDPRAAEFYGVARRIEVTELLPNGAVCKIVRHGKAEQIGKSTTIRADRFRPTKTGYKLVDPNS